MSHFRAALVLAIALLSSLTASAHGVLKFSNGLWWNGRSFEKTTMYSVENLFRSDWSGEVTREIDLGGRYVVPPFADAHNHVFADGANVERQLAQYLRAGIFYVENPNSTHKLSEPIRLRLNKPETVDVTYSFGGITAPGGHPAQIYESNAGRGPFAGWTKSDMLGEAYFAAASEKDLDAIWPRIVSAKPDFIKAYLDHSEEYDVRRNDAKFYGARGLSPALLASIVKRARKSGLRVVAHITTAADFRNAVAAGVDQIAHLPLERISPADAAAAAKRKITVVTTTLSHRPTSGIADLDSLHAANLEMLRDAGVAVALGTDAGNTVVDEATNVRRITKWTNEAMLNLMTGATAKEIFPRRKIGTLTTGSEASFLTLDGNPLDDWSAIRRVAVRVKQGHVIEIAPEKPSAAEAVLKSIPDGGAAEALAEYQRLEREEAAKFAFGEAEINRLGYAFLNKHRLSDAIAVFLHNTVAFPNSANVWDSLAEAYMKSGDRERAIANYRKSLALNPHNQNAADMLKTLEASAVP